MIHFLDEGVKMINYNNLGDVCEIKPYFFLDIQSKHKFDQMHFDKFVGHLMCAHDLAW